MKISLGISLGLNLALAGGVVYALAHRPAGTAVPVATPATAITASQPVAPAPVIPDSPAPFNWNQLGVTNGYHVYIANLRAIGCPEATITDIVRGDVGRAFAFERNQLHLDGSGFSPWSQSNESQMVLSLLSGQPLAGPDSGQNQNGVQNPATPASTGQGMASATPGQASDAYPLFLQDVNWAALGFTPSQQADINQVRQQFMDAVNNSSADSTASGGNDNPTSASKWHTAVQNANSQLEAELGAQGYNAYEMQQYANWFQPQAAAAGNGSLSVNPFAAP